MPSSFGGFEDGDSSCWRTQTTNRRPGQHRWITLAGRKVWGNDLRKYNNWNEYSIFEKNSFNVHNVYNYLENNFCKVTWIKKVFYYSYVTFYVIDIYLFQDCLYHHPVHKISFIAQDMSDSRAFGYIFGSPDTGHRFFGIKTDKAASQVRFTQYWVTFNC